MVLFFCTWVSWLSWVYFESARRARSFDCVSMMLWHCISLAAVPSMAKWLMNVVTLISGVAKHCWKLQDRKAEFLVMQCQEVCNVLSVTNSIFIAEYLLYTAQTVSGCLYIYLCWINCISCLSLHVSQNWSMPSLLSVFSALSILPQPDLKSSCLDNS